ncbi:phospholipase D-like domain-containing protein [Rufibacter sp. XAAS-G3-1]|uniref:phospholipase D-like domain-containing protein n=1 Tax=Rufibacter sp. XAAS-G3-1 TaxID=2729134 RepID=UPI0015E6B80E|nr:phospholipase D-like domain-containing protein [Rufibacter sp. XAAS-G3-1]
MFKTKLAFLLLLFAFSACKTEDDPVKSEGVTPYSASLNDLIFTKLDQVGSGITSPVIMDRLVSMIDAAPEQSSLHLSIFGFTHSGVISALKRASERNVNLHIMVDMSREETQAENPPTVNEIRGFLKPNSEIVIVTSDAGGSSINHNKFVIFSELNTPDGKAENMVFQTSHNFTEADSKKIQEATVLSNKGLYQAYLSYWNDMKAKAASGMKNFEYREFEDPSAGITAYFFPKRKDGKNYGTDTVIDILNQITEPSTALIRVGMSDWSAARMNVVDKLESLIDQGATVEVIAKSTAAPEIQVALNDLKKKGAYIKIYNLTLSNQLKINNHSKFMLIKGKVKGEQATLVLTGTHNYTGNAVYYNNEVILLFKNNKPFFDSFMTYYNEMKKLPGIVK